MEKRACRTADFRTFPAGRDAGNPDAAVIFSKLSSMKVVFCMRASRA